MDPEAKIELIGYPKQVCSFSFNGKSLLQVKMQDEMFAVVCDTPKIRELLKHHLYCSCNGRPYCKIDGKNHYLYNMVYDGIIPQGFTLDHFNGNVQDCRQCNLRPLIPRLQSLNRALSSNNTTGVRAIYDIKPIWSYRWQDIYGKRQCKSFHYEEDTYLTMKQAAIDFRDTRESTDSDYILVRTPPTGYELLPDAFFGTKMLKVRQIMLESQAKAANRRRLKRKSKIVTEKQRKNQKIY